MTTSDIDIGPDAKKDGLILKIELSAFKIWFLKRFIGLLFIHGTVIVVAVKLLC